MQSIFVKSLVKIRRFAVRLSCEMSAMRQNGRTLILVHGVGLLASCLLPCCLLGQESNNDRVPHPWLADVPPALARLVDIGRVEIEEDQPAVEAAGRTALTVFSFSLAYRMRYRINELGKGNDGKPRIRILVNFDDVTVLPSHKIQLSKYFRPTKPWESALLQHEFDHVAISSDPRMLAMLCSLDGRRSTLVVAMEEAGKPKDDWAKTKIEESTKVFRLAVEKLVETYYERLDEATQHGLRGIDDRKKFFTRIYSVEDLEKAQFPYVDDVRTSVEQIDSEIIQQHYQLP